jgi:hypothetical protein
MLEPDRLHTLQEERFVDIGETLPDQVLEGVSDVPKLVSGILPGEPLHVLGGVGEASETRCHQALVHDVSLLLGFKRKHGMSELHVGRNAVEPVAVGLDIGDAIVRVLVRRAGF